MLGLLLGAVGVIQIVVAALAFSTAKSNIHEIFSAILFTGGVLEIGVGAILSEIYSIKKTGEKILAVADPDSGK